MDQDSHAAEGKARDEVGKNQSGVHTVCVEEEEEGGSLKNVGRRKK